MEVPEASVDAVTILDVLGVDVCRRAILAYVDLDDIVRSERVSRRWQQMVLDYLQTSRLHLEAKSLSDLENRFSYVLGLCRTINIDIGCTWTCLRNIVEKLGAQIVSLSTNQRNKEFWEIIMPNCPHLQRLYLSGIKVFGTSDRILDQDVIEIFRDKDWEQIEIEFLHLTGYCLKSINSNNLKFLSLNNCSYLEIHHLTSIADRLRNVTKLQFNGNGEIILEIHLLRKEIPKVEHLSLCNYYEVGKDEFIELSDEFKTCISHLNHLKRLEMNQNRYVTSSLIRSIARGCEKLEYLDISYHSWRYNQCYSIQKKRSHDLKRLVLKRAPAVVSFRLGYLLIERGEDLDCVLAAWKPFFLMLLISLTSPATWKKTMCDVLDPDDPIKIMKLQLPYHMVKTNQKLEIVLY